MKVYQAQQRIEVWQKDRDKRVSEAAAVAKAAEGTIIASGSAPEKAAPKATPETRSDKKDDDAGGKEEEEEEDADGGVPFTAEEMAEK